jgi:hypothetical protein
VATTAGERGMLHNGAEQEADEIDHLLRGETLADRIEMRRVVGGECVIARDGFRDRTVGENLRDLLLGARGVIACLWQALTALPTVIARLAVFAKASPAQHPKARRSLGVAGIGRSQYSRGSGGYGEAAAHWIPRLSRGMTAVNGVTGAPAKTRGMTAFYFFAPAGAWGCDGGTVSISLPENTGADVGWPLGEPPVCSTVTA